MKKINKKVVILAIVIILAGIAYYNYTKDDLVIAEPKEENIMQEQEENDENIKEDRKGYNEKIFVHISGAINKEGVFEFEENSRVTDAIEKAGGLKNNASIKNINLASKLEDGMKIYIPTNEEEKKQTNNENSTIYNNSSNTNVAITEKLETKNNKKVNINTASQTELETLPGIGPSTALKIIEYRNQNGKFKKIQDIQNVSGIGDSKYKKIENLIVV